MLLILNDLSFIFKFMCYPFMNSSRFISSLSAFIFNNALKRVVSNVYNSWLHLGHINLILIS